MKELIEFIIVIVMLIVLLLIVAYILYTLFNSNNKTCEEDIYESTISWNARKDKKEE